MDNSQKEFLHRQFKPLIGGKIVGFRIDEDDFSLAPFPVLIINIHGEDLECAISADEEGNGGGFMFIEDYNPALGGKTQKGSKS